jgi:hypothetical protein
LRSRFGKRKKPRKPAFIRLGDAQITLLRGQAAVKKCKAEKRSSHRN